MENMYIHAEKKTTPSVLSVFVDDSFAVISPIKISDDERLTIGITSACIDILGQSTYGTVQASPHTKTHESNVLVAINISPSSTLSLAWAST